MSAATEIDPTIKSAIKLVHSSGSDSAEKIRQTLDELIKVRFSSSKMLVNVLSKKHLAEENTATGSGTATHPPHQRRHRSTDSNSKSSSSKSSSSNSSVSALEVTTIPIDTPIMVELETLDEDTIMEDDQLKELEELVCVVCRQVDVSFRNRLVECADCHSLYHQECHKPQISESDANDQEDSWICTLCKSKEISKPAPAAPIVTPPPPPIPSPPPHKSSSSSSSYKSSSKSHESSSSKSKSKSTSSSSSKQSSRDSSSSSSKESSSRDKSSSSSSSSMTPKINIISADKRIQIMKKKAKLNEGKRKHK